MKIFKTAQGRQHGKTIEELGYSYSFAKIYRAVDANVNQINNMDYVTLKSEWAIEHAEHNAVVKEEPQIVLSALVPAKDVAEAYNPGEYFYIGSGISQCREIYKTESS